MDIKTLALLIIYTLGLACGQILFKLSAIRQSASENAFSIPSLISDPYFISAITLYGSITIFWIWILTKVSLGLAYPFVALSFVFTPILAYYIFGDKMDIWYVVGLMFILVGLLILFTKATPSTAETKDHTAISQEAPN
ncbi:hypothetical protein KFE96_08680 [Kordiimonas sp. SCSIO 12603]|uniref:hypothetical protein n=1 Tax=Kordiimonas sp. SCSIO 12603 TaxID=2829596 RepID=UPI0021082B77|nr:hypothetical protein [Kordiimonas sp. SCSIO 12603]UTW60372.1 hypothetical protein KFE96_08680 [Kordiimonas sp. SCSIO 12603]